nr:putative ribonuclease H-like domain-containing protein [Tanacetum cinerariifolium]
MKGNHVLLTNFVEKFLGTVRFGNNDFAVIAGYGEEYYGKRYVLVVVDDYSRYTRVLFLHSKDEASEVIISFIKKTQVNLQLQVQRVRTDNGTEFKSKTITKFFDEVGITQQFFAARTPQQNGVVERRNRTLVEAARTMLTFTNLPSFLWAEAIATACFTQNCSIIHKRFDKTPYELINKRKQTSSSFVCSDAYVIFSMIMKMLESSRLNGIWSVCWIFKRICCF